MTLFGVVESSVFSLPHNQQIISIEQGLANFSYDMRKPPDFRGLFLGIVSSFTFKCKELDIIQRAVEILANIAGYKLGVYAADIFMQPKDLLLQLIGSPTVAHLKTAVDYFRKVSRAIGPRAIIEQFIAPMASTMQYQRGLVILAHQMIIDNPQFSFTEEDFGEWVNQLVIVVGVGQRLANAVRERFPHMLEHIDAPIRPPSVPIGLNMTASASTPLAIDVRTTKPPLPPPKSARPQIPRKLFGRRAATMESGNSIMFQMTSRQQQVREFIDAEFTSSERVSDLVEQMRNSVQNSDWEERSAGFNLAKRILRYQPDSLSDDDIHILVTAVLDDIGTPRAALALAACGALEEGFRKKAASMEFELARIIPVLIRQHQKTAQFFESALSQCFEAIVQSMTGKRFLGVLMANGETRSSKVQAAVSKYVKDALQKCMNADEKIFAKNSGEVCDLVRMVYRLSTGAAVETRDCARESVRLLAQIYSDSFNAIVSRSLESRAAGELLRVL